MFGAGSDIPPLCSPGGALVSDPARKAELLSTWFDSKQSRDIVELPQTCHPRPAFCGIVALPLEHVRLSGTCWILIQMVEWTRLVASLCSFGRMVLRCGEFPLEWRIADVTPIPNYQVNSITAVLSKVFERLINFAFWSLLGEFWGPVISPVSIQKGFGYL